MKTTTVRCDFCNNIITEFNHEILTIDFHILKQDNGGPNNSIRKAEFPMKAKIEFNYPFDFDGDICKACLLNYLKLKL